MNLTDDQYQIAAATIGCEVNVIKAVAKQEASGAGINTNGTAKLRFEVHWFFRYFKDKGIFVEHFKFDPVRKWTNHQAKLPTDAAFLPVHTTQAREWDVFNFACSLDNNAAMLSVSLGAFQIMGFNYDACGFDNVADWFAAMNKDEGEQLKAFAVMVSESRQMKEALQKKDWLEFAEHYNGSGQAEVYAAELTGKYKAIIGDT